MPLALSEGFCFRSGSLWKTLMRISTCALILLVRNANLLSSAFGTEEFLGNGIGVFSGIRPNTNTGQLLARR